MLCIHLFISLCISHRVLQHRRDQFSTKSLFFDRKVYKSQMVQYHQVPVFKSGYKEDGDSILTKSHVEKMRSNRYKLLLGRF